MNGKSVLLQFRSLLAVENYIKEIYLRNAENLQCDIQFIRVESSDSLSDIYTLFKETRKRKQNLAHYSKIIGTAAHEKRKNKCDKTM